MSDEKMQELNQDLLEDDDDLLADIPMSLLYTSPIRLTEEDLLLTEEFLLDEELPAEEELPTMDELFVEESPVMEELPIEEETPEPEALPDEEILLADEELNIEDIIAEFHTEPKSEPVEAAPVRKKPTSKPKAVKEKADAPNKDRSLIILMAIASFLCIGIIGMLIYWLEVFL